MKEGGEEERERWGEWEMHKQKISRQFKGRQERRRREWKIQTETRRLHEVREGVEKRNEELMKCPEANKEGIEKEI